MDMEKVTSQLLEKEHGIPPGSLDTRLTDDDILKIYQLIVFSATLASRLGLKDAQIHAIEQDAPRSLERSLYLLKRWKQQFSIFAKRRKLIDALLNDGLTHTACEVLEALFPNTNKTSQLAQHCHQQQSITTIIPVQEQTPDPPSGQEETKPAPAMEVDSGQEQGQKQSQPGGDVQDISEGVHGMDIGGQSSHGESSSGQRVDVDGSSTVEKDGVEDDILDLRKKDKPKIASKSGPKKSADQGSPPKQTEAAINPSPNPPRHHLQTLVSVDDEYKMEASPQGIGIIINNKTFDPRSRLSTRKGTDVDAKKLEDLFAWLGFDTRRFDNQSADEMKEKLRDVAVECDKHGGYDCLMVAILSHGGDNGVIWGSDGQEVMVKSLTRYFNGSYCKSLVNKPKVFILQACRGGKKDRFVETTSDSTETQPDSLMPGGDDAGKVETDFRKSVPTENGFILAFSTTPGYLSWRHTDTGSWYINVLENEMRRLAGRRHFVDILTKVNRKLCEGEEFVTETYKQMASYESRLTRSLYFNPPNPAQAPGQS